MLIVLQGNRRFCGKPVERKSVLSLLRTATLALAERRKVLVRPLKRQEKNLTNGAVAGSLGDAFAQARDYPRFKDSPADYSAVDAAIAKANGLNKDEYKDFSAVEAAVNAVVPRQDRLPNRQRSMPWRRLSKMPLLPCNTRKPTTLKVDAAIAKANALKKDDYKDFTAVEAAVNAVVRDKKHYRAEQK